MGTLRARRERLYIQAPCRSLNKLTLAGGGAFTHTPDGREPLPDAGERSKSATTREGLF